VHRTPSHPSSSSAAQPRRQALERQAADLRLLFVTVDPGRDRPERLRDSMGSFHPFRPFRPSRPSRPALIGSADAMHRTFDEGTFDVRALLAESAA